MNFTSKAEETKVNRVAQHARKSYRGVAAAVAVVGMLALSVGTAQATDLHKPLFQITEVPAEGPAKEPIAVPGQLEESEAGMTVDSGHLWLAGGIQDGVGVFRVDDFDAGTGALVSQLLHASHYAPQYNGGVAVVRLPGHPEPQVYVPESDELNSEGQIVGTIGVYSEAGTKLASWTGAGTPEGSFDSNSPTFDGNAKVKSVAVDSSGSPSDWATGDILAATKNTIDVFHPQANAEEKYVTQLTGVSPTEPFDITNITVNDTNGDLIVATTPPGQGPRVDVFEPTALEQYAFIGTLSLPSPTTTFDQVSYVGANDGEGDIYVVAGVYENGEKVARQVFEFDAAGEFEGTVPLPAGAEPVSVVGDPETHGVFVSTYNGGVYAFGPNSVTPDVTTTGVSNAKPASATLNGTIDPAAAGVAECSFVWGTTTAYGHTAPCPSVAEGNTPQPVQAPLTGLEPDTTYHYRLQATNGNGTNMGEPWQDQVFTTPGPGVHAESVVNVEATSATFDATVAPNNAPTNYYIQYGTSTEYGQQAPAPPGEAIGSGATDVQVPSRTVTGLSPGALYHYRVVAVSEIAPHEFVTVDGADHTFTTQAAHGSFTLVDGRQWEMVSSPSKLGSLIEGAGIFESLMQASAAGDAIAYRASSPTESEPHGGFANAETVLSARGAGGWSSRDISSLHDHPENVTESRGHEFQIFSEDLSRAAVQPTDSSLTLLSPEASESTAYLRSDFLDGSVEDLCTASCYRPLVTGKAGFANVPAGTVFGEEPHGRCEAGTCGPRFQGASPDLSHIVLSSPVQLTATPAPAGGPGLYEWSEGSLQLLDLLPHGEEGPAALAGTSAGSQLGVRHSVSDDGERVVMERHTGITGNAPVATTGLYLRDVAAGETIRLDVPQGGVGESSGRVSYMDASSDASRIFFLDSGRLTADASPSGEDLYEYNLSAPAGSRLTDLSVDSHAGQSANVQMMLGSSEDGSYVYFAAAGALAPGAANGACCNLYVRHEGVTQLAAVLPSSDRYDWSRALHGNNGDEPLFARVSPNGRWLAFMSQAELTGYDTRDAVSGQQDDEVYLYRASAAIGEASALICASCDPTGARPVGELEGEKKKEDRDAFVAQWVSGSVVPWTGFPDPFEYGGSFATHQPRYLSNSGRLFFDSTDALVPQDVDGVEDVYEYEPEGSPAGEHACSSASTSGSVVFKPARSFEVEGRVGEESAGCVGLISSGTSSERSWFLDASESGGDVFFITQARLAQQDEDTAFDVYDAHECTSSSPCTPVVTPPPPCDTEASCKAAPESQPSLYGAPSSATFSGAGNITTPSSLQPAVKVTVKKAAKCPKGKTRNKHQQCVKAKKKKQKKTKTKTKGKKSVYSDRRAGR